MHHIKVIKDGNVNNVVKEQLVDGVQYMDDEPREGSLNGITSGAVAKVAGDVGDLKDVIPEDTTEENPLVNDAGLGEVAERVTTAEGDIDSIEEKIPSGASSSNKLVTESDLEAAQDSWQSGFTPKGEATVSQIDALTTQSNGDQYIVTDSGTITEGNVAVVAGDTVAWDSENEVWYKVNQYAKASEQAALTTYAQNVAHSIAPAFDPTRTEDNPYKAGESVIYEGKLYTFRKPHFGDWSNMDVFEDNTKRDGTSQELLADFVDLNNTDYWQAGGINSSTGADVGNASRIRSKMFRFSGNTAAFFTPFSTFAIYCYDDAGTYLGFSNNYIISELLEKFPTAKQFRISLIDLPSPAVPAEIIGVTTTFTGYVKAYKIVEDINETNTKVEAISSDLYTRSSEAVDLNNPDLWIKGGVSTITGKDTTDATRLHTDFIAFKPDTTFATSPSSSSWYIAGYDKNKTFVGWASSNPTIADVISAHPTAIYFKFVLMDLPANVQPSYIGTTLSFTRTYYKQILNNLFDRVEGVEKGVAPIYTRTDGTIDLNNPKLWRQGGISISTGRKTTNNTRLHTDFIAFKPGTKLATNISASWYIVGYNKNYAFVGAVSDTPERIDEVVYKFPTAVYFKIVLMDLPANVQPSYIGTTLSFTGTYYTQAVDNLFERVDDLFRTKSGLYKKTWYACGDSFTADGWGSSQPVVGGDGPYANNIAVYPYYIGQRTGCNVKNIAAGGQTIAQPSDSSFNNVFTKTSTGPLYTTDFSDADYITLYFGINDSHQSVPIGTIDDADNTTFYGAWNVALDYLTTNYPFAHIGIIVSNGCDSAAYPTAVEAIAKKWGINYLDLDGGVGCPTMLRCSSRNPASAAIKARRLEQQRISSSNYHPNEYAHEFESHFIEAWLKTL